MITNNKGFSLIATLVMSAVVLAFLSALIYFVQSGSRTSASLDSYKSSLEIAKGASELIMKGVDDDEIECSDDADYIDEVQEFMAPYDDDTTTHVINVASYRCEKFYTENSEREIYIFTVQVQRNNTDERAEVDFGYMKSALQDP
ncbi:hypothetical protein EP073_01230 [Geovibrio thiophilus]|uniref:Uncharacterized protein n=1 Tax=Geovibrio thiophilus TaxID=139438 RepID=A0A3R5UXA6_9BACT|nr:hypothetical protein [Geovibrio thiophilus]QAR32072.1 hypothetical protein EP073_01230 [Geovibrio thiophilus]